MADIAILQITTAFSWLSSLINFIVTTIYLDDVVSRHTQYQNQNLLLFFVILSVWVSCFKFGVTSVIFPRLETGWKLWVKAHCFFFTILVIIFSIAVSQRSEIDGGSKGNAYTGIIAIEFVISFCGSIVVYLIGRRLDS